MTGKVSRHPSDPAPIAFFLFRRPDHTRQAIEALAKSPLARETALTLFADGPRNGDDEAPCQGARTAALQAAEGAFASVEMIVAPVNKGLSRSVIEGVSRLMDSHGRAIVVEDDICLAPCALTYLNKALEIYSDRPEVFSISTWMPPSGIMPLPGGVDPDGTWFCLRESVWGWASWADRWAKVDWELDGYDSLAADLNAQARFAMGGQDRLQLVAGQRLGRLQSWDSCFTFAHFINDGVSLKPIRSLSANIGMDGSGTHCGVLSLDQPLPDTLVPPILPEAVVVDLPMTDAFRRIYACPVPPWIGPAAAAYWASRRGALGRRLVAEARSALDHGDVEATLQAVRRLLDVSADDPDGLALSAAALQLSGHADQARELAKFCLNISPDHAIAEAVRRATSDR